MSNAVSRVLELQQAEIDKIALKKQQEQLRYRTAVQAMRDSPVYKTLCELAEIPITEVAAKRIQPTPEGRAKFKHLLTYPSENIGKVAREIAMRDIYDYGRSHTWSCDISKDTDRAVYTHKDAAKRYNDTPDTFSTPDGEFLASFLRYAATVLDYSCVKEAAQVEDMPPATNKKRRLQAAN